MLILDGKALSAKIQEELAFQAAEFEKQSGMPPHLAAVLVGNSGPSETYVAAKMEACRKVGFRSSLIRFSESISEQELLSRIDELNEDPELHGFIVQLPLPAHISVDRVIERINPDKDVDGFHPMNLGRLAKNQPCFASATPWGIIRLLESYKIETAGRQVVILGRSQIVGLPMALLLSRNASPGNATVSICHSKSKNPELLTRQADILIAALGSPEFVKADMIKPGAVVIDVGIHRIPDVSKKSGFRLVGDVDFTSVAPIVSAITPVPGGVGPMTIAALMENTLRAAQMSRGLLHF